MKRNEIAKLNSAQAATNRFGIGMLTPTLIVLLVMTAYPLIFTFVYSFTDYNYLKGTENASFVLFDNYVSLFKNGYFQQAVWNTIKFTILAVVLEMALGLLIAVFVNSLTACGNYSCKCCGAGQSVEYGKSSRDWTFTIYFIKRSIWKSDRKPSV